MANLLSAASSVSKRILTLIPAEKDWSRLFKNLLKGIMNSDELALQSSNLHLKIRRMKKVIKNIVNEVLVAKAETKKLFLRVH